MIDPSSLPNDPKFILMDNIIHVNEKWFNAFKKIGSSTCIQNREALG